MAINESTVEEAALEWFQELGYATAHGMDLSPGGKAPERGGFGEVVLEGHLRAAIDRLNREIPAEAREDALRKLLRVETGSLVGINRRFHHMLRDGVEVEFRRTDGSIAGARVQVIDFEFPQFNNFLVVQQLPIVENQHQRRPDLIVYVNGLPLGVIELKNAASENASIWGAWHQLQTYKQEIPSLFHHNAVLVISDGLQARLGSLTASQEWFKIWRSMDGLADAPASALQLETLIRGVFPPARFLQLLRHFIVFEEDTDSDQVHKIVAGYHQLHAVNAAVEETVRASGMEPVEDELSLRVREDDTAGTAWAGPMSGGEKGDRRCGVVWHTQGSGKSFSMLFYAGRIIEQPEMRNPTLVVLTDRNDLDDQLFGQFQRCHEILRQMPVQAASREELRRLLQVASGGVVFTTMQKFMPETRGDAMPLLSERRNIVVVADEAHRSQYDLIDGLARNLRDALPHASFIGFTGTPIEKTDANTRAIFGDYISVYDIARAVEDQATVPIYYESRIAKLALNQAELPKLDEEFEELTEGEEESVRDKLRTKWAALEALVGDPKRIKLIAKDLVEHFERRREAMEGKAMVVCMSRRICVDLYDAIVALRPDWASAPNDDVEAERGQEAVVKIVMTGSAADGADWQKHIRSKQKRKEMAKRFKDVRDPFRIVIVRDMWLTGFDVPCLTTMYVDKPMRGHGLMQAIARVNRVFKDKPGGLVVDYLGLADQLKHALATYTESGGQGDPAIDTAQAIAVMLEKWEICCGIMHGFDWSAWIDGGASERLKLLPAASEHVLEQENGKRNFVQAVTELSRVFALCAASDEATEIRDDVGFFQAVKAALTKGTGGSGKSPQELDHAVRQLVSKAILADDQVIDVFTAAGMKRPDISILSDQFLAEVRGLKHKNVAAELLAKLLKDEIKVRSKHSLVQSELFSEKLVKTLQAYHNRAIATQEIIEELLRLAKDIRDSDQKGIDLGLTHDEYAFYTALAVNDSALEAMGIDELKVIAAELVTMVRSSVSIDWTLRENARAQIRVMVKRILRRHGYPPDLQEAATQTVLRQAELLCSGWADT